MTPADTPSSAAPPGLRATYGPFLLLCLLGFAGFFCSYMRIPVLPLFAASLGAGPDQVGLINGAFMLATATLSIPAGLLADRVGRRFPVVAGLALLAVTSFLVALCGSAWQMAAVYLLFGAGVAAFAPAMLSLVADTIPPSRLGQAYGWYTTAIYLAMTLGPAAGGFLGKSLGLRQVFIVAGGLLALVSLCALAALPSARSRHGSSGHAVLYATCRLLRNRRLVACLLATVGSCVGFGAFLSFLPLYAAGKRFDPAEVGIVFAVQALANVVSRIPVGFLADRVDRRLLVAAGLLFFAAGLSSFGLCDRLPTLMLCALVMGVGMALAFTAIGALVAESVAPVERGLAMGMYNSSIYIGMMAGSATLGTIIRLFGFRVAFAAGGIVALFSLVLFAALTRHAARAAGGAPGGTSP